MKLRFGFLISLVFLLLFVTACKGNEQANNDKQEDEKKDEDVVVETPVDEDEDEDGETDTEDKELIFPEESTFFSTVYIEEKSTLRTESDGDLWPAAWSDDDYLYTANGDGKGFNLSSGWGDLVVNRVSGHPNDNNLQGERLASGAIVGLVWSDPKKYNKKPTGMVSVNGDLYLAVQDLNKEEGAKTFNDVPASTILKSTDKGQTWEWDREKPMFDNYVFTTVMFLDYGKDGENNTFDDYVYAYGLDNNWRDSFSDTVEDPTKLYLARMPKDGIQDVSKWEFYTGDLDGNAQWSEPGTIEDRKPVLQDDRRVYSKIENPGLRDMSVISQGSIVYNKPLNRYIYSSWTEYTFEFYEAPTPWGPWKRFLSKDFGHYPWSEDKHGGYATVIPSKFISDDGKDMWVNSQTFMGGIQNYAFSLRKMRVTPYEETTAENAKGEQNLAVDGQDVTPISRTMHFGVEGLINNGNKEENEDSWNNELKEEDYWGYTWSRAYNLNNVVYTTGNVFFNGGWFTDLRVQVRQNFEWIDVENVSISPDYPNDETAGVNQTYTLSFDDTWGDGVRIIGTPGGSTNFTSIAELEVYFK
nr:DUF4185 domain-containing protein [Paenibacillus bovis]